MRTRLTWFLLASLAAAAVSCSSASAPNLNTCCVVSQPSPQGGPVCFCGSSSMSGAAFAVKVSGSTCTVTNTGDGGTGDGGTGDGGGATAVTVPGQPPATQADCANPVSS